MSNPGENVQQSFTNYLRKKAQVSCPFCRETFVDNEKNIRAHLTERHGDFLTAKDNAVKEFRKIISRPDTPGQHATASVMPEAQPTTRARGTPDNKDAVPRSGDGPDERPPYKQAGPRASSPRRSRAQASTNHDADFKRETATGKLWSADDTVPSNPRNKAPPRSKRAEPRARAEEPERVNEELIKQPETRPISQEQLVAEVKGIYAGLVMVESKCIEVDNAQSSQGDAKLNNEQWQALIALHRTLLHEHHDFFLASQHPSASPALRRLASKYAMPARMWRHGIHSFLELLRHRLTGSLEHMLTFIYMAYSMMALLYETVPAFEDTWIECLGDLGRYRMAIEDDDIRDREVWTAVSRHWYSKASDKAPTTGRLYHHLAILARPNALQQLFYYAKSLCVPIPFPSARESIMTLFDPVLNATGQPSRLLPIDAAFVKAHGILFSGKLTEEYSSTVAEFLGNLDNHIGRTTRWMESGYYVAIANCCSLLSYGKEDNVLYKMIRPRRAGEAADATDIASGDPKMGKTMEQALLLAEGTHEKVLPRFADPNILPYVHVVLVFLFHLRERPSAMGLVDQAFPWKLLSMLLNSLLLSYRDYERIHHAQIPRPEKESPRPLPEDFAMKGLLWVDDYFPADWFANDKVDDDEKYFEVASMTDERKERILWLGVALAKSGKWLVYDERMHQFSVAAQFEKDWMAAATTDSGADAARSAVSSSRLATVDDTDEAMDDVAEAAE